MVVHNLYMYYHDFHYINLLINYNHGHRIC